jgi:hypothetical protein
VTVVGNVWRGGFEYPGGYQSGAWVVDLGDLPDIGLRDGDEVEVTIRLDERATGSLFAAPEESDE